MIQVIEILLLVCCAGFFDYMMDAIKDFGQSEKFWFWRWCKNTKYQEWCKYGSHIPLPFFKKYNPSWFFLSDSWHMMKHGLILSFTGAVVCAFDTYWYFQIAIWIGLLFIEGEVFDIGYQRLKK